MAPRKQNPEANTARGADQTVVGRFDGQRAARKTSEDAESFEPGQEQLDSLSEQTGQVAAYWRGNERRFHDDATYNGPDRRLVAR
jgi:hypothetical protein